MLNAAQIKEVQQACERANQIDRALAQVAEWERWNSEHPTALWSDPAHLTLGNPNFPPINVGLSPKALLDILHAERQAALLTLHLALKAFHDSLTGQE